jgi:hypothetical protein
MSNLVNLDVLRKIKGLERSIKEKREILSIREEYLNKLSRFQKYDTIRIECHELDRSIFDLSITIGIMESKLIKLEKELKDEQ